MKHNRDRGPVWYASYGSNVRLDRFLCYIRGGRPKGSSKNHEKCSDNSFPQDALPIDLNRKLRFAGTRTHWGAGGVAFVSTDPLLHSECKRYQRSISDRRSAHPWITYGRMYKITYQQFLCVLKQENGASSYASVDFGALKQPGQHLDVMVDGYADGLYNRVLLIGHKAGVPILTFTNPNEQQMQQVPPAAAYAETICAGIVEMLPNIKPHHLADYLIEASGSSANEEQLTELARDCVARHRELLTPEDGWFEVCKTHTRAGNRREFIAQLNEKDRKRLGADFRSRLTIRRNTDRLRLSTNAFLHNASVDAPSAGKIALDHKIRVAIGVPNGAMVHVSPTRLDKRTNWFLDRIERWIGSQPVLTRVRIATFEDMEISVCRLPEEVFDLIGVSSGDYVRIESAGGRPNTFVLSDSMDIVRKSYSGFQSDSVQVSLRALQSSANQIKRRIDQVEADKELPRVEQVYSDIAQTLDLHLVRGASQNEDHPAIFIDEETRNALQVAPGETVRVTRDWWHLLRARVYFVTIPTSLAAVSLVARYFSSDDFSAMHVLLLTLCMFVLSTAAVVVELRNKLS